MKSSHAIQISLVVSVAALLTGCEQRPVRYCVDAKQDVVDDANCMLGDPRYHWYYASGYHSIANGTHLNNGSYVAPSGGYAARASDEAGTIRGGIGAAGEAAAGHGGGGE